MIKSIAAVAVAMFLVSFATIEAGRLIEVFALGVVCTLAVVWYGTGWALRSLKFFQ